MNHVNLVFKHYFSTYIRTWPIFSGPCQDLVNSQSWRRHWSLRELAQDIRRLMTLAYPGEKSFMLSEHIARDAFLSTLADPEFELKD